MPYTYSWPAGRSRHLLVGSVPALPSGLQGRWDLGGHPVREAAASAWAARDWPPTGEATIDRRTGMAPNAPVPMAGESVMGT
jgi:hypothetical protein